MGLTGTAGLLQQHGGMRQPPPSIRGDVRATRADREGGEDKHQNASDGAPGTRLVVYGAWRHPRQGVYPMERIVKLEVSAGLRVCAVRLLLKSTH